MLQTVCYTEPSEKWSVEPVWKKKVLGRSWDKPSANSASSVSSRWLLSVEPVGKLNSRWSRAREGQHTSFDQEKTSGFQSAQLSVTHPSEPAVLDKMHSLTCSPGLPGVSRALARFPRCHGYKTWMASHTHSFNAYNISNPLNPAWWRSVLEWAGGMHTDLLTKQQAGLTGCLYNVWQLCCCCTWLLPALLLCLHGVCLWEWSIKKKKRWNDFPFYPSWNSEKIGVRLCELSSWLTG